MDFRECLKHLLVIRIGKPWYLDQEMKQWNGSGKGLEKNLGLMI